jgi:hypothetical protein
MCGHGGFIDPVVERPDQPPDQGTDPMPDPRARWFIINERQDRWWLYGDDRRSLYQPTDALPLPTEPQRERASYARRLAFRLRLIIRPRDRVVPGSAWTGGRKVDDLIPGSRPGRGAHV